MDSNVPTALASAPEAARAVVNIVARERSESGRSSRSSPAGSPKTRPLARPSRSPGIPHYAIEADAVQGFMHLGRYREARDTLMETPASLPKDFDWDVETVRRVIARAIADEQKWLDPLQIGELLTGLSHTRGHRLRPVLCGFHRYCGLDFEASSRTVSKGTMSCRTP
jgi:acetyltransferase